MSTSTAPVASSPTVPGRGPRHGLLAVDDVATLTDVSCRPRSSLPPDAGEGFRRTDG